MRRWAGACVAIGAATAGSVLGARSRQLRWGASEDDASRPLPGDELIPRPDTCFVVDERGVVLGRLGRRAIRGRGDVRAEQAMTLGPSTIRPSARLREVAGRMQRQQLTSLPVTASDGRLVGLLLRADAERALVRSVNIS
jgi:hypothetical protein